jgi:hypothetical protein
MGTDPISASLPTVVASDSSYSSSNNTTNVRGYAVFEIDAAPVE